MGVVRIKNGAISRKTAYSTTWAVNPPYHWLSHMLTVVRDGCTEDGVRIHFVSEDVEDGMVLSNALIFGNYHPAN